MSAPQPPPDPAAVAPPPAPPARRPPRWLRVLAPVGVVTIALGGFAVAQAASERSGGDAARDQVEPAPSTTSTSLPDDPAGGPGEAGSGGPVTIDTVSIADAIPDGATQTFAAGAAGSVTINRSGPTLTVVSSTANPGWAAVVESANGPEVEVKFTSPTTRVDLEAEIEDGGVRVRVRERALVTDPAATTPAPPRADDSGPGSTSGGRDDEVDDDHGSSGRGSDDTPDLDDDHGGSSGSSGSRGRGGDDD